MCEIFVIILIIILGLIYLFPNSFDYFCSCNSRRNLFKKDNFTNSNNNLESNYPYNPPIPTPQSNYSNIVNQIKKQNECKKDLSVDLNPIPTIQCAHMDNKEKCNYYGCNWFGEGVCSAAYPIVY